VKKFFLLSVLLIFNSYGLENHHIFDRILQSLSNHQVQAKENNESKETSVSDDMHNPWLQREQLFKLYTKVLSYSTDTLSLQSIDDLQLYCGTINHPSLSLFNRIDRTVTSFGQGYLAYKLANPITDISVLQQRQVRIQQFEEDVLQRDAVDMALHEIARVESAIYGYWNNLDDRMQQSIDALYFTWLPDRLNNSAIQLEVRTRFFQLLTTAQLLSNTFLAAIPDLFAKSAGQSNLSYAQILKNACMFQLSTLFGACRLGKLRECIWAWQHMKSPGKLHLAHLLDVPGNESQIFGLWSLQQGEDPSYAKAVSLFEYPVTLIINGINIYGWQKTIKQFTEKSNLLFAIHKKVNGFAKLCQQVKQLEKLVGDVYPLPKLSPELDELYTLLNTATFNYPSHLSGIGRVLKAHRLICKYKDEFAKLFAWLGEIDADISMTKLIKEHKNMSASFTYVSYDESNKVAYIFAKDFWNPFINPSSVVVNTIELGQVTKDMNVVLTGSNAGGKSTLMKAVLFNIILAQTFGIAAAKQFSFKPFGKIYSSMQLVDDLADGKSHFAAEIDRAKDIVATSKKINNGPVFLVIDELFTGTASDKGRRLAEKMLTRLFGANHCMTICATHFNELTDLTQYCNCINMRLAAPFKDEYGKLSYPYILEPGISTINVAEDMFDEIVDW